MKHRVVLFVTCLWLSVSCSSTPEVGVGVLHFEDTITQKLTFFDTPGETKTPVFYVELVYEEGRIGIRSSLTPKIDTLEFHPLYARYGRSVLVLQVLEQQGDWFKVYTDDIVGVTHWVKLPGREVEAFRTFLPTTHTVKTVDRFINPLRENPHDEARAYGLNPYSYCLKVVEVQGAWLKVRNDPERCPEDSHPIEEEFEGFLRWKKEERLLVFFTL